MMAERKPWYFSDNGDVLLYLLVAIFFLELIVGGVSFFYGIIHAAPEYSGGPPVARFPWLAWVISALLAPVFLILVFHLAGTWLSTSISENNDAATDEHLPESMKRFYASVRHAPGIILLLAIIGLGIFLFFVDGAFAWLGKFTSALLPYLPWLAVCAASLFAFCFFAHAFFAYRRRKLDQEYAWRREVLAKTGIVLVDSKSVPLSGKEHSSALPQAEIKKLAQGEIVDIEPLNPDKDAGGSEK